MQLSDSKLEQLAIQLRSQLLNNRLPSEFAVLLKCETEYVDLPGCVSPACRIALHESTARHFADVLNLNSHAAKPARGLPAPVHVVVRFSEQASRIRPRPMFHRTRHAAALVRAVEHSLLATTVHTYAYRGGRAGFVDLALGNGCAAEQHP